MKSSPTAVIISDVHYNLQTLEIADKAMNMALDYANELNVPLIVAGDLHDTKANMRGECMNAMIKTFSRAKKHQPWILRGNHDQINEKSSEHSLTFLEAYANIVDDPEYTFNPPLTLIPYQSDPEQARSLVRKATTGIIIMHQGLAKTNAGHYFQDHSALNPEDVAGRRIISGHYHTRQTIALPKGGIWDFIGNPYTLGFGEANDPPKGFQILMEDGSLAFCPTNLRKHVIYETTYAELYDITANNPPVVNNGVDLVWVKVTGPRDSLAKLTKYEVEEVLGYYDVKLDLIPEETVKSALINTTSLAPNAILDAHIDSQNMTIERKEKLKLMWKALV